MTRPPILEDKATPVPGKLYTLVESFMQTFTIVKDPFKIEHVVNESTGVSELVEKRVSEGPMVIRGIFQREGVVNANKRVYPKGLWEKHLRENSDLMTRIGQRRCVGQIEHPEKGSGSLRNAAILVTKLTLDTNETKDGGRAVIGEAEVLDTPDGRILRDLIRSRVTVGVSSRATGSVDGRGQVEEKTFNPETWDVVGNPSTPGAFPTVVEKNPDSVKESVNDKAPVCSVRCYESNGTLRWSVINEKDEVVRQYSAKASVGTKNPVNGERRMSNFNSVRQTCRALLSTSVRDASGQQLGDLDESLATQSVELNRLLESDASLRNVVEDLQVEISKKRAEIAACDEDQADEDDGAVDESESDSDDDESDLAEKYQDALAVLQDAATEIEAKDAQIKTEAALNNTLTERLAAAEKDIASLTESLGNAQRLIAALTEQEEANVIQNAVDEAISKNAALEGVRAIMERSTTLDEVRTISESYKPAASEKTDNSLPPKGKPVSTTPQLNEKTVKVAEESDANLSETAKRAARLAQRSSRQLLVEQISSK